MHEQREALIKAIDAYDREPQARACADALNALAEKGERYA